MIETNRRLNVGIVPSNEIMEELAELNRRFRAEVLFIQIYTEILRRLLELDIDQKGKS